VAALAALLLTLPGLAVGAQSPTLLNKAELKNPPAPDPTQLWTLNVPDI
jgi:hypothetical protein